MRHKRSQKEEQNIPKNIPHGTEVLSVQNVSKKFGYVEALRGVSLSLRAGEVHALVGGNGAGKSTLVNIICGTFKPNNGELYIYGEKRNLTSPREARNLGIGTVHQNLAIVENMDVTANLFLGRELLKPPPLKWLTIMSKAKMRRIAIEELQRLRITIPSVDEEVRRLSGGQRQGVVCARALMGDTPIMLMDEPTAALGVKEGGEVIDVVNRCKEEGAAILLISHNMKEVFAMAQRVTVLRLGEVVAEGREISSLTEEAVVGLITGAIESADDYDRQMQSRGA